MIHWIRYAAYLMVLGILTACSSVDSLKPFDQEQAAIVIRGFYPNYSGGHYCKTNTHPTH